LIATEKSQAAPIVDPSADDEVHRANPRTLPTLQLTGPAPCGIMNRTKRNNFKSA
jgi:hypothetical protein